MHKHTITNTSAAQLAIIAISNTLGLNLAPGDGVMLVVVEGKGVVEGCTAATIVSLSVSSGK